MSVSLGLDGTWRCFEQVFDYPSVADSKNPETVASIERITKSFNGDRKKAINHMDSIVHEALKYAHENREFAEKLCETHPKWRESCIYECSLLDGKIGVNPCHSLGKIAA